MPKRSTLYKQIAKKKKCSSSYVGSLSLVREYRQQKRFKKQPAEKRIRELLAKGNYNAREVAEKLNLSEGLVCYSPEWRDKQNRIRQKEGKEVFQYKIQNRIPSQEIEKSVKTCIADLVEKDEKVTLRKVAHIMGLHRNSRRTFCPSTPENRGAVFSR